MSRIPARDRPQKMPDTGYFLGAQDYIRVRHTENNLRGRAVNQLKASLTIQNPSQPRDILPAP